MDFCIRNNDSHAETETSIPKEVFSFGDEVESSLSSGINRLAIPELYNRYIVLQQKEALFINDYDFGENGFLRSSIKLYEKLIASDSCSIGTDIANDISLTVGATQAISSFFDYFACKYSGECVLALGLNYYLFYKCCKDLHIKCYELLSKQKDRIRPSISTIKEAVKQLSPKLIVLSLPFNPSGEIYSEEELGFLIEIAKEHDCLLLIDKCQQDEFAECFEYVNINKVIVEHHYVENTVLINSLSKTRSIPGMRVGYIVARKDIIDFVKQQKETQVYCPPSNCVVASSVDFMLRVFQYGRRTKNDKFRFDKIRRIFVRAFSLGADFTSYKKAVIEIFSGLNQESDYEPFRLELGLNWSIVKDNYALLEKILGDEICEITPLEGGFNVCIKVRKSSLYTQNQFAKRLRDATGLRILSEDFFSVCSNTNSTDYWIRISLAQDKEEFGNRISRLKKG